MNIAKTAFFVRTPKTVADLWRPHLAEQERSYKIVKTIILSGIAYENFSLDLLVDRQFIEDNAALCSEDPVWNCMFVHQRGRTDGILVIPEMGSYVKWAAYISEK